MPVLPDLDRQRQGDAANLVESANGDTRGYPSTPMYTYFLKRAFTFIHTHTPKDKIKNGRGTEDMTERWENFAALPGHWSSVSSTSFG